MVSPAVMDQAQILIQVEGVEVIQMENQLKILLKVMITTKKETKKIQTMEMKMSRIN